MRPLIVRLGLLALGAIDDGSDDPGRRALGIAQAAAAHLDPMRTVALPELRVLALSRSGVCWFAPYLAMWKESAARSANVSLAPFSIEPVDVAFTAAECQAEPSDDNACSSLSVNPFG